MDNYLLELEKIIKTKKLSNFWVFPNDKPFKPIVNKTEKQIIDKLKKNQKNMLIN